MVAVDIVFRLWSSIEIDLPTSSMPRCFYSPKGIKSEWVSEWNQLTSSHNFLNLKFPRVTKKEFLLTLSIQVQEDKWWEYRKYKYLIGNYLLVQYQTPQSNIIRIVWQTVRRIIERSWKWKGQRKDAALYSTKIQIRYLWRCSQGFQRSVNFRRIQGPSGKQPCNWVDHPVLNNVHFHFLICF